MFPEIRGAPAGSGLRDSAVAVGDGAKFRTISRRSPTTTRAVAHFRTTGESSLGAFGARMRAHRGDQLAAVAERLRSDPASRRAFISVIDQRDTVSRSRDFPCAIGIQFYVREQSLEALTIMRSQSALMVLPYDAALFMLIHVWLAAVLGLAVGTHTWLANSFHLYDDELQLAQRVIADPAEPVECPPLSPDAAALDALQDFERYARHAAISGDPDMLRAGIGGPAHARGVSTNGIVLAARSACRLGEPALTSHLLRGLPPSWAATITTRSHARDHESAH